MTHDILLAEDATLAERSGRLIVDLAGSSPERVSLGLSLLSESLVDDVVLRPPRGPWVLKLRSSAEHRTMGFRRYGNHRVELTLGRVELDRWRVFFLKYYRDGSAEVDHLDSDGAWDDGTSSELTLKVSPGPRPG